jgi:hypothetical protein
MNRKTVPALGACIAMLFIGGCGGSTPHKSQTRATVPRASIARTAASTPCAVRSRDALARYLALAPASVSVASGTGNNGMPQCTFTAHPAHSGSVSATANIYTGPQPFAILDRTVTETSQVFGPKRFVTAPTAISNLGVEADWFPNLNQLMSTDTVQLVTVTMHWPAAPVRRQIGLAVALTRTYLKKLSPQEIEKLAKGEL